MTALANHSLANPAVPRAEDPIALRHAERVTGVWAVPEASACLQVDLAAIRANFAEMRRRFSGQHVTAVVKSDAYGLGLEPVVASLAAIGCDTFWVNGLDEAVRVRAIAPDAAVFALLGLTGHDPADFAAYRVTPVLLNLGEMFHVAAFAQARGTALPAAVQIDTGLGRLGLTAQELGDREVMHALCKLIELKAWVSHLAAFDRPDDPRNDAQHRQLVEWLADLPAAPVSLASSSGVYRPPAWHFDIARVGSALYGVQSSHAWQDGLIPCYRLSAPILRIADYPAGSRLGYAGTELTRPSRIATVAIGYANGLPQRFGLGLCARIGDVTVAAVGGLAMNLTMIDVTDVPAHLLHDQAEVVFLDAGLPVEPLAVQSGCSPNALLTAIGAGTRKVHV